MIAPSAGEGSGVTEILQLVPLNGLGASPGGIAAGCAMELTFTVSIFLPPFVEGDDAGDQVLEYKYTLFYDATGDAEGLGTVHTEFQTESGKVEDPCTEALGVTGGFTP
jgi:hypothetical protein